MLFLNSQAQSWDRFDFMLLYLRVHNLLENEDAYKKMKDAQYLTSDDLLAGSNSDHGTAADPGTNHQGGLAEVRIPSDDEFIPSVRAMLLHCST